MRSAPPLRRLLVLLTFVLASIGCQVDDAGSPAPGSATQGALTYWGDVAPILNAKCVHCHQNGGVGPFPLDGFEMADKRSADIAAKTRAGIMPPYLVTHDGSCGEFEDAETLTAEQIETLQRWAAGPRVAGTARVVTRPPLPGIEDGTSYTTPTLVPVAQGGNFAEFDEYRCFAGGQKLTRDAFIVGYDVAPGNGKIVHHVAAMLVDPNKRTASGKTNAEQMKALDDSDPDREGWPCYSLAGEGVELDSVPIIWAPGQGTVLYPNGIGVRQRATDQLVIQLHYNLADPAHRGHSDSTTVRVRHADSVQRRAIFTLTDAFIETVARGRPESLAPGMASVKYAWTRSGAQLGLPPGATLDLVGVMPHMHTRGVAKQMTITGPDGVPRCAAKVDRWDFNWQKFYFYKGKLPQLDAASQIQLTCEYNTMMDMMPVFPGWGTRNEMCIAILMLALPPGG
jgi:Copper type II ascorbate-dependent monooxygenase, C-terminal domain